MERAKCLCLASARVGYRSSNSSSMILPRLLDDGLYHREKCCFQLYRTDLHLHLGQSPVDLLHPHPRIHPRTSMTLLGPRCQYFCVLKLLLGLDKHILWCPFCILDGVSICNLKENAEYSLSQVGRPSSHCSRSISCYGKDKRHTFTRLLLQVKHPDRVLRCFTSPCEDFRRLRTVFGEIISNSIF